MKHENRAVSYGMTRTLTLRQWLREREWIDNRCRVVFEGRNYFFHREIIMGRGRRIDDEKFLDAVALHTTGRDAKNPGTFNAGAVGAALGITVESAANKMANLKRSVAKDDSFDASTKADYANLPDADIGGGTGASKPVRIRNAMARFQSRIAELSAASTTEEVAVAAEGLSAAIVEAKREIQPKRHK